MDQPTVTETKIMHVKVGFIVSEALRYVRKAICDPDPSFKMRPWMGCFKVEEDRIYATDGFHLHMAEFFEKKFNSLPLGIYKLKGLSEGWADLEPTDQKDYPDPQEIINAMRQGMPAGTPGVYTVVCNVSNLMLRQALVKNEYMAVIEISEKIMMVRPLGAKVDPLRLTACISLMNSMDYEFHNIFSATLKSSNVEYPVSEER